MEPKYVFFTKGIGRHKEKLISFELALRDAKIARFNLVQVSSIFPPKCKIVSKEFGLKKINDGEIVFCVLSRNSSRNSNRFISSAVGVAIPKNIGKHGYLSEHHGFIPEKSCKVKAQKMAEVMMRSVLDKNESGAIESFSVGIGAKPLEGLWTTVVSAAVFII